MDNQIVNFLEENKKTLIQLYINERLSKGEGLLMITKTSSDNMNVGFFPFNDLTKELKDTFVSKVEEYNNSSDMIFFYICVNENDAFWIDINLRKEMLMKNN